MIAVLMLAVSTAMAQEVTSMHLSGKSYDLSQAQLVNVGAAAASQARAPRNASYQDDAEIYTCQGLYNGAYGMMYINGRASAVSFSEDGSTAYFKTLFPGHYEELWCEGTVSEDLITVSCQEIVAQDTDGNVLTIGRLVVEPVDDQGNFNVVGYDDLILRHEGDTIYNVCEGDDPGFLALLAFDGRTGAWLGFACYEAKISLNRYTGSTELVTVPESATMYEYKYECRDYIGDVISSVGHVYVDGDDVYMDLLQMDFSDVYVKGHQEGDRVTFACDQFLGIYYNFVMAYRPFTTEGGTDAEGNLIAELTDYVLQYDPETGVYTSANPLTYSAIYRSDNTFYDYWRAFTLTPYAGDVPTVPADPRGLSIINAWEAYGQYYFQFTIPTEGTQGEYLNPAHLAYYLYLDDDIYTVSPDLFAYVSEEMTLIPYDYADDAGGYDIKCGSVWLPEDMWTTLGVQSVYTVRGEARYSNVVSCDLNGNVYTKPAPQTSEGITDVAVPLSCRRYDLQGRRTSGVHGLNLLTLPDGRVIKAYHL